MAKNIIITPAPGGNPNIDFQGATSGTIKLEVRDDGSLLYSGGTESNILSLYDETANPVRVPSISLEDSNATHHLKIVAGSNLTANRTFTLSTGDAARSLDISAADVTISSFGASIVDDADASAVRTTLGVVIGTNVQAHSANLDTFAAIAPSANVQTLLGAADYAAIRTALSLVIGTNVQAYDADLTTWAGLTPSAYFQTLVDDTDASTARGTLGLGTSATVNTGTSGATIPLLDGNNTFSGTGTWDASGSGTIVTFQRTDDGATGPIVDFNHVSASPANNDAVLQIRALGKDNAGNTTVYGRIRNLISDTTDGSEDGQWIISAMVAGSDTALLTLAASTITFQGNTVWHAGNDGAGSTLDADLLDGKNTGTSGNVIPLLDGANTWSAAQIISLSAAGTALTLTSTDAGAGTGPDLLLYRNSSSPAASDVISTITWQGRDSAANAQTYLALKGTITDPTSTSEDATLEIQTAVAGTVATRVAIGGGLYHPSATGTDKGANTINFGTIYQNNVALASAAFVATGTSGATIPLLNGNNTYSGSAVFTGGWQISTTTPDTRHYETDGGTNEKYWWDYTDAGVRTWSLVNDAFNASTPIFTIDRTAHTSATFTFGSAITTTFTGTNYIKHATQSNITFQSSSGVNGWVIGRSIGNADGNDFFLYDSVNTLNRVSILGSDANTISFQGATNGIVTSNGNSGYGSFYAKGSGTNNAYIFFGNATNNERARINVDNSRNFVISVDGGTTSNILVSGSNGDVSVTGATNGGLTVTPASGYVVLGVYAKTTSVAYQLMGNNSNGERARFWADDSRNFVISTNSGTTSHFAINSSGVLTASGNTIWHAGNDGTGSGLDADLLDGLNSTAVGAGKQGIWIPAGAMAPRTTTGCAAIATFESSTNRHNIPYLAFDTTTVEYAQFNLYANKQFGTTTVTFKAVWMHPSTTTNFGVAWELAGLGRSDDDAAENAFGTAVAVTDTGGTTNDVYITSESSAITIGGSFAAEDFLTFQISRATGNGSDTMAVDAQLIGIMLYVTTTANTDV